MNREIKFRAWLTKTAKMSHTFSINDIPFIFDKGIPEDCIMLEWTGLKDIKGVDIHEGDIIKWGHISGSYESPERIAVVEINPDLQFRLVNGKHTFHFGNFIYKDTSKAIEIIGNIYQTPELSPPLLSK